MIFFSLEETEIEITTRADLLYKVAKKLPYQGIEELWLILFSWLIYNQLDLEFI